jgi:hypothetical protein
MNASDEAHSTLLYLASCRDCKAHSDLKGDLVRLLLSHDADVGARDAGGGGGGGAAGDQTPLQIAAVLVG